MPAFGSALLVTGPEPLLASRIVAEFSAANAAAGETEKAIDQLAEKKLARAEKNMGEEDYKRARVFAEQAELDARLAEARVLNQKSQKQLDELNARITRLRKQLGELP